MKKNVNHTEENQERDQESKEILEEIKFVNEARQNHKNDLEDGVEVSEEEKLQRELAEANDKYVRLYAEFDNYKRRTTRERIDLLQTAGRDIIVSLLPVLDDFERAARAIETGGDIDALKEGVGLVHQKLKSILSQKGLKEMESKGNAFDADVHEGVTNIPAPSDDLKGKVLDEVEKGYFLNDKVIRFAKVVVGS